MATSSRSVADGFAGVDRALEIGVDLLHGAAYLLAPSGAIDSVEKFTLNHLANHTRHTTIPPEVEWF
jgi:hypothetical protein